MALYLADRLRSVGAKVVLTRSSDVSPAAGGTTTYYSSLNPQADKSLTLGKSVQAALVNKVGLYNRGVKDAAFYVIKNTTMPAVLVELGFISNPTEEKLLGSPEFQKKAAEGIYEGIVDYKGL